MTDSNDRKDNKPLEVSRRNVLKTGAVATGGALIGSKFGQFGSIVRAAEHPALGNYPIKGKEAVFGFAVPLTGAYAEEGKDELRAYKLAVRHLNEGGGLLDIIKPLSLTGQGVLGKKITYVQGDSQTDPDAARAVGRRMIERDGAIMFSGGSSSGVAIAQEYLAQDLGVIFMCCLTHSNATTGKDRRRYGFRAFFNTKMTGQALAPVLAKEYGNDRKVFQLTADYTWGHSQYKSMKKYTTEEGWTTVRNIMTPLGTTDYSQYLTAVLNSDADVLILNHYGNDMVYSLTQAVRFGLKGKEVNGKEMQIVVPLYSRVMASGAGTDNIEGVYGTVEWNFKLEDEASKVFTKVFTDEYGFPPSQAAHVAYIQTLLYGDAVERAGTFYPPEVIKALEDWEVDGVGMGHMVYRGCDHQAFHDILVMQGKSPSEKLNEFDFLKIVGVTKGKDLGYACDYFPGELGPYKPA